MIARHSWAAWRNARRVGKRLVMDDQDNMSVSDRGDRIALAVFFIGVVLLAAGVVIYFAAVAKAA